MQELYEYEDRMEPSPDTVAIAERVVSQLSRMMSDSTITVDRFHVQPEGVVVGFTDEVSMSRGGREFRTYSALIGWDALLNNTTDDWIRETADNLEREESIRRTALWKQERERAELIREADEMAVYERVRSRIAGGSGD